MAFVYGSMTQGNPNSILTTAIGKFEGEPAVSVTPDSKNFENEKDKVDHNNYSDALPRQNQTHYHPLSRTIKELGNNDYRSELNSTSVCLLAHMNQPSPSEIQQWMADTQTTVDKVVTSWQHQIIYRSSKVSDLLDYLIKFVVELEENRDEESSLALPPQPPPPLPSIITAKCENKHGTFESVINVYLHLILISLKQVATTIEKQQTQEDESHRKTLAKQKQQQRRLLIEILNQFTVVAGDALKFLQTHDKILEPTCEKLLDMRNDLYFFLRMIIQQSQKQILPLMSNLSLDVINREEDMLWMRKCCNEYRKREMKIPCFHQVDVGAKSYSLVIMQNEEQATFLKEEDLSVNERLELILLLLRQLDKSIGFSNKVCKASQATFTEIHIRLSGKFQSLVADLVAEKKQEKLSPENCSEYLKKSLCQLEAKFHQAEKILEEIPHHLRRVIAVADQCSRQLIREFGLERVLELEDSPSWTSPIKDISEEFFKTKKSFVPGCFPYLWKILAKIILGGGVRGGTSKKLRQFWEEVRTEMEEFLKEIKMKEMETGYAVILRIPIDIKVDSNQQIKDDNEFTATSTLAKYALKPAQAELLSHKLDVPPLELKDTITEKIQPSDQSFVDQTFETSFNHASATSSHAHNQSILSHQQKVNLFLENNPEKVLQDKHKPAREEIVQEFKYVSEEYTNVVDKKRNIEVEIMDEPSSQTSSVPSTSNNYYSNRCNDYSCSSTDKTATTATHTDKLLLKKKLLESYLVDVQIG